MCNWQCNAKSSGKGWRDGMRTCPTCNSDKVKQTTSIFTRLLLSTYIFLTFLFFIGRVNDDSLIALFPLILPHLYFCLDCNNIFFRILPKWNKDSILNVTALDKYLFAILPSILLITLLITFFPILVLVELSIYRLSFF